MAQKILLIDDDEDYVLAIEKLLEAEGYLVSTAANSDEAGKLLESELPDLILLDVVMPGKDGFTLADELAENKKLADIPVVLVTSVADSSGQIMHAFEEGKGCTAANILPKSDAPERLASVIQETLGGA